MQTLTFFFLADGCAGGLGTPSMGLDLASENAVRKYCGSLHGTCAMYAVLCMHVWLIEWDTRKHRITGILDCTCAEYSHAHINPH